MAWDTTLVQRLRYYIGDIVAPQSYTDNQLAVFLAIAADYVITDIDTENDYVIDTDTPSITPDPLLEEGVSNLIVTKAACLIARNEFRRDMSQYGVKIRDDLTSYDATGALAARQVSAKIFCEDYDKVKYDWELGNPAAGRAIFGPFGEADRTTGYWSMRKEGC